MHHSRVPPVRRLLAIPLLLLAFGALAAPASADLPACAEAPCASDIAPPVILAYYRGRTEPYLIRAVQKSGLPDDTPIYYGSYWGIGVNTRPPPTTPPPPPPPGPRPVMPTPPLAPISPERPPAPPPPLSRAGAPPLGETRPPRPGGAPTPGGGGPTGRGPAGRPRL